MTHGFDVDVARVGFKVISISTLNDIKFVMPDRVREKLNPNDVSCLKVHTFDGYHRVLICHPSCWQSKGYSGCTVCMLHGSFLYGSRVRCPSA